MTLDTLSPVRELRAPDFAPAQAEALASAIGRSIGESSATRADLRKARLELKARIEALQAKLITWFVGAKIAFVAIIAALIRL